VQLTAFDNGFAERLIGSIRCDCLDHIIVLDETHLRQVLKYYVRYYNESRTHLSLDKDAPFSRAVLVSARIATIPVLRTASSTLPDLNFRQGQGMLKEIETERDAIAAAENMSTHTNAKKVSRISSNSRLSDRRSPVIDWRSVLSLL
jgi:hypothetical protein